MMNNLEQEISDILRNNLTIHDLIIQDESEQHIGHAGARDGAYHIHLTVVAEEFKDKSLIERHKMIYALLGHFIPERIHALTLALQAPAID